jgi:hypothetical protein
MIRDTEYLDNLMQKVIAEVVANLRDASPGPLSRRSPKACRSLVESEFYRASVKRCVRGSGNYKENQTRRQNRRRPRPRSSDSRQADKLFHEGRDQLDSTAYHRAGHHRDQWTSWKSTSTSGHLPTRSCTPKKRAASARSSSQKCATRATAQPGPDQHHDQLKLPGS